MKLEAFQRGVADFCTGHGGIRPNALVITRKDWLTLLEDLSKQTTTDVEIHTKAEGTFFCGVQLVDAAKGQKTRFVNVGFESFDLCKPERRFLVRLQVEHPLPLMGFGRLPGKGLVVDEKGDGNVRLTELGGLVADEIRARDPKIRG